jgi:hypothetical protein
MSTYSNNAPADTLQCLLEETQILFKGRSSNKLVPKRITKLSCDMLERLLFLRM